MTRDMELIRRIALTIADHDPRASTLELKFDDYDEVTVGHHVFLMIGAGLVAGNEMTSFNDPVPQADAEYLTWAGHDFADAIRNETVWSKTRTAIGRVGGATLPIWVELASTFIKEQLGLAVAD